MPFYTVSHVSVIERHLPAHRFGCWTTSCSFVWLTWKTVFLLSKSTLVLCLQWCLLQGDVLYLFPPWTSDHLTKLTHFCRSCASSASVAGCTAVLLCSIYIGKAAALVPSSKLHCKTISELVQKKSHKLYVTHVYSICGVHIEYGVLEVYTCSFVVLWAELRYKWGLACCTYLSRKVFWESWSMYVSCLFLFLNHTLHPCHFKLLPQDIYCIFYCF